MFHKKKVDPKGMRLDRMSVIACRRREVGRDLQRGTVYSEGIVPVLAGKFPCTHRSEH